MKPIYSTLFHIGELAVILLLVWGVTKLFPGLLPNENVRDVVVVVLAGFAKFARASSDVPVEDYVNKQ